MKITLLAHTPDPDAIVAAAAKVCYSGKTISEIQERLKADPVENRAFIKRLLDMGHESPFEHISFNFALEGVSRTLTHQLVRHRIASYSQKSQRYVSEKQFGYYIPESISSNTERPKILDTYNEAMNYLQSIYDQLVAFGVPREDARYVLPNACNTTIIVTMNARSLFNFFNRRCCSRAQLEIRTAAYQMLRLVKEVAPMVFATAGPICDSLGYCPEDKFSCHRKPTLADILDTYSKANN